MVPVMELDWVLFGAPERTDFCIGPGSNDLIGGLEWIRGLWRSWSSNGYTQFGSRRGLYSISAYVVAV